MSDTLSETRACGLLSRIFRARGYTIERNVMFHEYGVEFHVDGWDAAARVGFEFLSSEDDDHDDLDLGEYQTLMAAQQRGELSLFIVDEVETLDAAELTAAANEFLDEMETAVQARREARSTPKRRSGSRKPKAKVAPKPKAKGAGKPKARGAGKAAEKTAGRSKTKAAAGRAAKAKRKPAKKPAKRTRKA